MSERTVLVVDVGGSHVKALVSTASEPRRFRSGKSLTAASMVERVLALVDGWSYDVVSVGVPAQVVADRVVHDPVNLASGWSGFDLENAFGKPTRVVNDAAMQALGSYEGGRMLYLGLGTGLGSAMVVEGIVEPMELGHLPYRKETYEDYVGKRGLNRLGRSRWEKHVHEIVAAFAAALQPDYVVLGGGQIDLLRELPAGTRPGDNKNAFVGGFRLWDDEAPPRAEPP
jgi:predicted NBD/HSP70 family sugar kinase